MNTDRVSSLFWLALGYIVAAPKGLPEPVYQKLMPAVKKVTDGEEFQKLLKHLDLPYDFKDGNTMGKGVAAESAWYKEFLPKMGGHGFEMIKREFFLPGRNRKGDFLPWPVMIL